MNTTYKTEQSKNITLTLPVNSTDLRQLLAKDAEVLYVDVVSLCISHSNGKEYRLKQGYRSRVMPGSQFASTVLAEDFLSESKRIPGNFELAYSVSTSPDGFLVSASSVVDKDPNSDVTPRTLELQVTYLSAEFNYNGTIIPGNLPALRLSSPMVGIKIDNVGLSDSGDTVVESTNLNRPLTIPQAVAADLVLNVGDWLIITRHGNVVAMNEDCFVKLFSAPLPTSHFPDVLTIEQQMEAYSQRGV